MYHGHVDLLVTQVLCSGRLKTVRSPAVLYRGILLLKRLTAFTAFAICATAWWSFSSLIWCVVISTNLILSAGCHVLNQHPCNLSAAVSNFQSFETWTMLSLSLSLSLSLRVYSPLFQQWSSWANQLKMRHCFNSTEKKHCLGEILNVTKMNHDLIVNSSTACVLINASLVSTVLNALPMYGKDVKHVTALCKTITGF